MTLNSIVKWVGGKVRTADLIAGHIGTIGGRYFEPFVGGGAVLLKLLRNGGVKSAVASDTNDKLIRTWKAVQADPAGVGWQVAMLPTESYREKYYEMRAAMNEGIADPNKHAAVMLWLNRACFNGLWRENKRGALNTPCGRYAKVRVPTIDELTEMARLIADVTFMNLDFMAVVEMAGAGDVVYCDPPFVRVGKQGFDSYGTAWDGDADQRRLANTARWAAKRGARVLLSNHDTPEVRSVLYPEPPFRVLHTSLVRRDLSAGTRGAGVGELLAEIGPETL
jgi:DNA adenine methylase